MIKGGQQIQRSPDTKAVKLAATEALTNETKLYIRFTYT